MDVVSFKIQDHDRICDNDVTVISICGSVCSLYLSLYRRTVCVLDATVCTNSISDNLMCKIQIHTMFSPALSELFDEGNLI